MATATALVHIKAAFRKLGIKTVSTVRQANGLEALNNLISNLSAEGFIIPYTTRESFALVVGTSVYTIGSGGDFDTVRPLRITNALIRDSNDIDYPLDTIMTEGEYNKITLKTVEARPVRMYYNTIYPLAKIIFDSEPISAETLYIDSWKAITELAAVSTVLSLPDEYKRFFVYNLALELAPEEKIKSDRLLVVSAIATESKDIITSLNSQPVEPVVLPAALTYKTDFLSSNNILSDGSR